MTTSYVECPPFFLFDDDGRMDIYESAQDMFQDLEWPYVADEVKAVFDNHCRQIFLTSEPEKIWINSVSEAPDPRALQRWTEAYFARWTNTPPPDYTADPEEYAANLTRRFRES